jgi:hypothetical protein
MTWQSSDQRPPIVAAQSGQSAPDRSEEWIGLWPFVWILFGFKLATALIIWWFAAGSEGSYSILAGTHWFWLAIPILAMSGPAAYQWRLRRVRRKRARLQAAEWMVDELRPAQSRVRMLTVWGVRSGRAAGRSRAT